MLLNALLCLLFFIIAGRVFVDVVASLVQHVKGRS